MWRGIGLVRTDVSEEPVATIFRIERIRGGGTALAVSKLTNTLNEETLTIWQPRTEK
jgi:hypothetical protein